MTQVTPILCHNFAFFWIVLLVVNQHTKFEACIFGRTFQNVAVTVVVIDSRRYAGHDRGKHRSLPPSLLPIFGFFSAHATT